MNEANLHRVDGASMGLNEFSGSSVASIHLGSHPGGDIRATGIAQAAMIAKSSLTERQVQMGVDLNNRARWAVVKANLKELAQVLSLGANPAKPDEGGDTLLHIAARTGVGKLGVEIISFLLDKGVPLDAPNCMGRTALHEAAEAGHANIVKQLLHAGANSSVNDARGLTPQDLAEMQDHSGVANCLRLARG